ncbi:iron-sulfur cluster-binding protein [Pseudomonas oryzae]|uniref:NAD(P)H-flavin reductase n=1 Tax=Pseudomonas oryzae TaxID=1392877 RepID=A0A1H1QWQ6_9PSED|nr:FAD-binding oxidoreductase [Pseudomonas oryzae]SDS27793.1 NAD(P)H-flavin reductase [Pseudomonas oryzae]
MLELTPRVLRLVDCYDDGLDSRNLTLRIDQPQAGDRVVIPGQFFMLGIPGQGEAPFTYVSPPNGAGEFTALVRRTGKLTARLFELQPGALLGYRGPYGKGWPLFLGSRRVLVVAGGCGLAPLAGLIEEALRHPASPHLRVLYGARSAEAQVLGRERVRWRQALPLIETLDQGGPAELRGSPLAQLDRLFAEELPQAVLCCGPEAFMHAIAQGCLARGVTADSLWLSVERRMHCAVGLCGHCYIADSYACVDGPTYRYDNYLELLAAGNGRGTPGAHEVC